MREMPVFLGHGTSDPLIPLALAQSTANLLRQKGFSALDFRTYPGVQHSIGPQELQDIREFILKVLPEETAKPPALYVILLHSACFGLSRPLDSLREASDCCTIAISQHRLPAVTHHMQGAVREMSECDARCNLQGRCRQNECEGAKGIFAKPISEHAEHSGEERAQRPRQSTVVTCSRLPAQTATSRAIGVRVYRRCPVERMHLWDIDARELHGLIMVRQTHSIISDETRGGLRWRSVCPVHLCVTHVSFASSLFLFAPDANTPCL